MSDFVEHPLQKKLNRKNIFSRVDKLESKTGVGPSARLNALSDLSPNLGEQVAGIFKCVDPNTGSLRGYMAAIPQPNAPGYHLAFFDNAGVFQFGVDANNGSAIAGGGVVTLDENGVSITVPTSQNDTNSYKFTDGSTVVGGLYGYSPNSTIGYMVLAPNSAGYDTNQLSIGAFGDTQGRLFLNAGQNGVSDSSIDMTNSNMDIDASGTINLQSGVMFVGTSEVGIGGNVVAGQKLTLYGTSNLAGSPISCNMLTRDPTSTGAGTWARAVSTSFMYNGYFGNNATHANGDNFTVNFYLPAGTYKLRFNSTKSSASGIIKVEVGATNLGDTDLYAASPNYTNVVEYTNITIATGGLYAVKFTLNSKNGSSSSYYFDITEIEFIRTA